MLKKLNKKISTIEKEIETCNDKKVELDAKISILSKDLKTLKSFRDKKEEILKLDQELDAKVLAELEKKELDVSTHLKNNDKQ